MRNENGIPVYRECTVEENCETARCEWEEQLALRGLSCQTVIISVEESKPLWKKPSTWSESNYEKFLQVKVRNWSKKYSTVLIIGLCINVILTNVYSFLEISKSRLQSGNGDQNNCVTVIHYWERIIQYTDVTPAWVVVQRNMYEIAMIFCMVHVVKTIHIFYPSRFLATQEEPEALLWVIMFYPTDST